MYYKDTIEKQYRKTNRESKFSDSHKLYNKVLCLFSF